ncbi:MAG: ATP-binding cassette domain-containing protein [Bryobacteraceae bacterium]
MIYRDKPVHVVGWARRFMFRAEQLDVAVGRLSGGERARLLIARLMLEPADLLLLDEPTNDLDISTLEVLEESLIDFPGALVLVTHDRYMLDRVSTTVIGLDGGGGAGNFADYSQWEAARASREQPKVVKSPAAVREPVKKRLSYKDAREWDTAEVRIHEAEARLADCQTALVDSEIIRDPKRLEEAYRNVESAQAEVDRLFERWAELEAKQR